MEPNINHINSDRMLHTLGVANRCYEIALTLYGLGEEDAQKAFLCGWLHDIGYAFGNTENHGEVGAEVAAYLDKDVLDAIRNHGSLEEYKKSENKFLKILDRANMEISGEGRDVTFADKLKEIKDRKGDDSPEYAECVLLVDAICKNYSKDRNEWKKD